MSKKAAQKLSNVNLFKSKIKHWECTECPCKVCKTYLKNIGYMFNVSSKLIKPCNKVMRISAHFQLQVFLYQTFYMLYFKVVSGVHSRTVTKHLRLSFYKNRQQMLSASIMNVETES